MKLKPGSPFFQTCTLSAWLHGAASTGVLAVAMATAPAFAQQTIHFSIAPQPLGSALEAFSRYTNLQIASQGEDILGKQSKGVQGSHTVEAALQQLLAGSGLEFSFEGPDMVVVYKVRQNGAAAPTQEKIALEEIVVTAQKREQNVQDIPMSINAFSDERLKVSGVHDVIDLQALAAGLSVSAESGITKVHIRGIGNDNFNIGTESGVATHRDGIYIAQMQAIGLGFFDVERIEVLRGPQGTLYGRNATGGAVNIISKTPTPDFVAGGGVTLGNYDLVETEGYASGPIVGDKLMGRFAFKTRDHDGYTPNIFTGESLDDGDFTGFRAILRYEPVADFRLDLTADYARDDSFPVFPIKRNRTGAPTPVELAGGTLAPGRAVNNNNFDLNEKEAWGVTAKAEWDMGGVALSSLTAWRKFNWLFAYDLDKSEESFSFYQVPHREKSEQISEELILSGGKGNLDWVLGAYYFYNNAMHFPAIITLSGTNDFIYQLDNYTNEAYAVFCEANYFLIDRLTLTLGARYSYEEKDIENAGFSIPAFALDTFTTDKDRWNSFTPKVALAYEITNSVIAYATLGRGFKAGGYAGSIGSNALGAFGPEEVVNYELGLKSASFDGRLRANIAAFYMDYSDLQVQVTRTHPASGFPVSVVDNAATAEIYGLELELEARPTQSLTLDANVSWLDATFVEWRDAPDAERDNAEFDVSGNRLLNAPEWAVNLGAGYVLPIGQWGSATLRGEYAYKSRTYYTPFEDDRLSQKGYALVNARLTFEDATGRWSFAGWVRNLTDEEVVSLRRAGAGADPDLDYYLPPRTHGVTMAYQF